MVGAAAAEGEAGASGLGGVEEEFPQPASKSDVAPATRSLTTTLGFIVWKL